MMSEEEECDNVCIQHRPSWRSLEFNNFLDEQEQRYSDLHPKSKAYARKLEEDVSKDPPFGAEEWMISWVGTPENLGD